MSIMQEEFQYIARDSESAVPNKQEIYPLTKNLICAKLSWGKRKNISKNLGGIQNISNKKPPVIKNSEESYRAFKYGLEVMASTSYHETYCTHACPFSQWAKPSHKTVTFLAAYYRSEGQEGNKRKRKGKDPGYELC